jgi:hypothetical protein
MLIVPSHKWLGYSQMSLTGQKKPALVEARKKLLASNRPAKSY